MLQEYLYLTSYTPRLLFEMRGDELLEGHAIQDVLNAVLAFAFITQIDIQLPGTNTKKDPNGAIPKGPFSLSRQIFG